MECDLLEEIMWKMKRTKELGPINDILPYPKG